MDKKAIALVCGAVGGCIIGAGYLLWRLKSSHSHHKHSHGPFTEDGFITMWTHTQYTQVEKETEILNRGVSINEALQYYTKLSDLCKKYKNDDITSRALDIGCSMGRTTFDLTQYFDEVIGIDTSAKSIARANQIKAEGRLAYRLPIEGDIMRDGIAMVKPEIDRNKAHFRVADACSLSPDELGQFGLIIAVNTVHHVPDPMQFLSDIGNFLVPGGILIIGEMYSWHDMLDLPKERWVSGYVNENGEEVRGPDGLKKLLSPSFDLLEQKEMQTISRWNGYMYMIGFPEFTVWCKK